MNSPKRKRDWAKFLHKCLGKSKYGSHVKISCKGYFLWESPEWEMDLCAQTTSLGLAQCNTSGGYGSIHSSRWECDWRWQHKSQTVTDWWTKVSSSNLFTRSLLPDAEGQWQAQMMHLPLWQGLPWLLLQFFPYLQSLFLPTNHHVGPLHLLPKMILKAWKLIHLKAVWCTLLLSEKIDIIITNPSSKWCTVPSRTL